MGVVLHLKNPESLSPKAAYCEAWMNWPSGSAEDIKMLSMYFCYEVITSPWKKAQPFY